MAQGTKIFYRIFERQTPGHENNNCSNRPSSYCESNLCPDINPSGKGEDELDVKIHENTLNLKIGSELVNSEAIEARLHYVWLSALEVARGGRVQCFDTLSASFLELDILNNQGADICYR